MVYITKKLKRQDFLNVDTFRKTEMPFLSNTKLYCIRHSMYIVHMSLRA